MSYTKAKRQEFPEGTECSYCCGQQAYYFFPRSKMFCCSQSTSGCPIKKEEVKATRLMKQLLKDKYSELDLNYVKEAYPYAAEIDILDGTLRFNEDKRIIDSLNIFILSYIIL